MHVRVTWSPKYDEMLETAKGMREQIASLFVRGPARGLHGGSARKNAGCAQKKPKGLKSGTCCGTGARVGVETRPAHEPTGGRVTTRKRGRGGASQEVWGDGVEGAAAARSSKASRSTNEIRGLAFAAAGKHWLHLPDEEAEAERSKSTERKAAPKDATPQDAAPKEAAPGARVSVETRPAQEPKGGRVATRKRGRGGAFAAADHTEVCSGEWQDNADQPNAATGEGPQPAPKDATPQDAERKEAAPKDDAESTERNATAGEPPEHRVQQLEQRNFELERQVLEEKHKQQIMELEARVAAIQAEHHALAFKLQVQEREKRAVIEQTLQQVRERTRHKELQLARINQGAIGKENTAPPGQAQIKDIWLVCATPACSRTWKWTPGSQAFYKSVGKGTPKYCPGCRK